MSMGLAIGQVVRLRTRNLYASLNSRLSWGSKVVVSAGALEELHFWFYHLADFNGQSVWKSPSALRIVFSDASDTGYGGGGYCRAW